MTDAPQVSRIRHELKRRQLTVIRVERLPPNMVRIVLGGDELEGFTSLGFDDHIKLFIPVGTDRATPAMRDFTPRRFDPKAGELWIDFFLHAAGPAAAWASQATIGQTLQIAGPKGSAVIALEGIDAHFLIGDETGLPAINRRLEELPTGARTVTLIETDAQSDRPVLASRAALDSVWVDRRSDGARSDTAPDDEAPGQGLIDALRRLKLPPSRCFYWIAVESRAARAIRTNLCDERGVEKKWVKAAGYWQRGAAGAHDRIADDA